tara:strand:- start:1724 stop:2317 length:594 start_codon:yes stop_codon:yes gene_type:complete
MNFKFKNIGIAGVAGCGKNTLADMIIKLLKRLDLPYRELSLASNLKKELRSSSSQLYGIDSFACSRKEKVVIRPFLVAHGVIRRGSSNGRHWVELLNKDLDPQKINIITDIRFNEYEKDEVFWLRKEINGVLIHLARYEEQGSGKTYVLPANEEESRNEPLLKRDADFLFEWKSEQEDIKKIISAERLLKWVENLYV